MALLQPGEYRVILGRLVIINREPDGDTLQFNPDDSILVQYNKRSDPLEDGVIGVRLESIDAPEKKYQRTNKFTQPVAIDARDRLLALAGFVNVQFDAGGFKVTSVDNPGGTVRAAVVARGGDGTTSARLVGYVFKAAAAQAAGLVDGQVIGDPELIAGNLLKQSFNYRLADEGLVYPSRFDTTPTSHHQLFAAAVATAQAVPTGIWAATSAHQVDATVSFDPALVNAGVGSTSTPIMPMVYRRYVDHQIAMSLTLQRWVEDSVLAPLPARRDVRLEFPPGGGQPSTRVSLSSLLKINPGTGVVTVTPPNGLTLFDATILTAPEDKIELADLDQLKKLAPGEKPWMFKGGQYDKGDAVHQILTKMAGCRLATCPVVTDHPFYYHEVPPPPTTGASAVDATIKRATKLPVMPVVPTRTAQGKVMVIGTFPTAIFTTRLPAAGNGKYFLPIANIMAPLESVPHFDGYKTRDVLTAEFFQRACLDELGLDPGKDLWVTNLVKCFMFKDTHANAYKDLGWTDPAKVGAGNEVSVSATAYGKMMETANLCGARFLVDEAQHCQPKLIVTLGRWGMAYMRGMNQAQADKLVVGDLVGQRLRADDASLDGPIPRTGPWATYNVMHMYHPEAVIRAIDDGDRVTLERHAWSVRELAAFLDELGIKRSRINLLAVN